MGNNSLDAPRQAGYPGGYWAIEQFDIGGPARVWRDGPLPKFHDDWLKSVVYIYGSVQDARDECVRDHHCWPNAPGQVNARAATGCLVEIPGTRKEHGVHQYVVTARHVVKNGCLVKPRFSFLDPTTGTPYIVDAVEDEWECNILPTDLAVLPLDKVSREVSRTVGDNLWGVPSHQGGHFLPSDMDDVSINIGDDVAMPGRFYPVSGGALNRPVTRFGNIATWPPTTVDLDWIDRPVEAILVEMRSHSGYSGSPAYVFGGINHKINTGLSDVLDLHHRWGRPNVDWRDIHLLGIDCGHLVDAEKQNTNMAIVIPWFKVVELLDSPKLKEQRRAVEQQREAERPPTVSMD